MDAPIDPSWLPATTATCCATFVAIVGGLLAARNVAVSSDRHAADERVKVLVGLCGQAKTEVRERLADWVQIVAEQWLESVVRYIVDTPNLSASELLHRQGTEAKAEQLQPHVEGWELTVRRMNTRINMMLAAGQVMWPMEWPNAKDLIDIELPTTADEFVAARVYAAQHSGLSGVDSGGVERLSEPPSEQALMLRREIAQSRLTEARRIERELTTRLAVAQAELSAAKKSRVAGKSTIWILGILSVLGIAWPLTSIAIGLHRMPGYLKWIDIAVVVIGIPLVLWLLLRNSPDGTNDKSSNGCGNTESNPTSPWGVLKILDSFSRLRGSVHARAASEIQPAVSG